jgi:hypothetical protein
MSGRGGGGFNSSLTAFTVDFVAVSVKYLPTSVCFGGGGAFGEVSTLGMTFWPKSGFVIGPV